jgi:hypothetical protein
MRRSFLLLLLLWIPLSCAPHAAVQAQPAPKPCDAYLDAIGVREAPAEEALLRKLAPALCDVGTRMAREPEGDFSRWSTPRLHVNGGGEIQVYVRTSQEGSSLRKEFASAGLRVETITADGKTTQGWISFRRFADLATIPDVERITPPSYGVHR